MAVGAVQWGLGKRSWGEEANGLTRRTAVGLKLDYWLLMFIRGELPLLNVLTIMINSSKQVGHGANTYS